MDLTGVSFFNFLDIIIIPWYNFISLIPLYLLDHLFYYYSWVITLEDFNNPDDPYFKRFNLFCMIPKPYYIVREPDI